MACTSENDRMSNPIPSLAVYDAHASIESKKPPSRQGTEVACSGA